LERYRPKKRWSRSGLAIAIRRAERNHWAWLAKPRNLLP
jgi:hypothetical protein